MERRDPTLYYGTKQLHFGRVNFKFTGGGNHPLRKTCYRKKRGSGRRGLSELWLSSYQINLTCYTFNNQNEYFFSVFQNGKDTDSGIMSGNVSPSFVVHEAEEHHMVDCCKFTADQFSKLTDM